MDRNADDHRRSRAVLIGVAGYSDPGFPAVPAALNSLIAFNRVLTDPELCGWPAEQVTVLANPHNSGNTALTLRRLARDVDDVLLVYYVGHGKLTVDGQLCLTVVDTIAEAPEYTGISYEWVARALRDSPARVKVTVLDCCFSGQAIEALAAADSHVADITHVAGVYTLTATTRNNPAHVPPLPEQPSQRTSFTGELLDIVEAGLPDGPPRLTFADIYPHLQQRLAASGLPRPSQRGTDTATKYTFANNAALQDNQPEAPPAPGSELSSVSVHDEPVEPLPAAPTMAADDSGLPQGEDIPPVPAAEVRDDEVPPVPVAEGWDDGTVSHPHEPGHDGRFASRLLTFPGNRLRQWQRERRRDDPEETPVVAEATPLVDRRRRTLVPTVVAMLVLVAGLTVLRLATNDGKGSNGELPANEGDGEPDESGVYEPVGEPLSGHEDSVRSVAFSPEGTLASGSVDGTVRLWDVETGGPIGEPLTDHEGAVLSVAFSPDGTQLAASDETVRLWDPETGDAADELSGHEDLVRSVAFSGEGILASGGDDGTVRLWDVETGDPIGEPLTGHDSWVLSVAFSRDGTLASAGSDGTVRLWDVETGDPIGEPLTGHGRWVRSVAFSPDGAQLASGGDDRTVRLWDVETGDPIGGPLSGHDSWVLSVAFSRDGTLASGTDGGTIRLWEPVPS